MATLTFLEKKTICRLFGIEGGYIFCYWQGNGYNKNTTRDLLADACGIDIYKDKEYQGLSQQKCVEKIWNECAPKTVAKLLEALCDFYAFQTEIEHQPDESYQDYTSVRETVKRLNAVDGVELPKQEHGNLFLIVRDIEKILTREPQNWQ